MRQRLVILMALLAAVAACNERRSAAELGGADVSDVDMPDAPVSDASGDAWVDAAPDASVDTAPDAAPDIEPDTEPPQASLFDPDPVLSPDVDPTAVLDVVLLADANIAVLWSYRDEREAFCPDCDADDLGDACPDACAREFVMLSIVDRDGVLVADPVVLREWHLPTSSHLVLGAELAERDRGDLVVAWRLCTAAPAYTCRAEWQVVTRAGIDVTPRQVLYQARYGGLRLAVNERTDDVAFVHYPDLSAGRAVGYALYDEFGAELQPWTRLGSAGAFRADVADAGRGFVVVTGDPAPDVPSPDCPYCESFLCPPDPRCDEARSDEGGLQLWSIEPGREPSRELVDAPRNELGGYPGYDTLDLRTRGGAVAVLAIQRFGGPGTAHWRVAKDDPWQRADLPEDSGLTGGALAWYDSARVAWAVQVARSSEPPGDFTRDLLLAAGDSAQVRTRELGTSLLPFDSADIGTGADGRPVLVAYILSDEPRWGFLRLSW